MLAFNSGDLLEHPPPVCGPRRELPATRLGEQFLCARLNLGLDAAVFAAEKLAERPPIDDFVCESVAEAWFASELLMAAHLLARPHAQQKGDIVLRQGELLAVGEQVILGLGRKHGKVAGLAESPGLQDIGAGTPVRDMQSCRKRQQMFQEKSGRVSARVRRLFYTMAVKEL